MFMQIGQKPESDFHEPIGMLEDCHKRILFFVKGLITLTSEADAQSLDPGYRVTLEKSLKYFREAAPRHTADEEESFFPRLRQIDSPAIDELFIKIDSLETDHRWADQQHLEVDAICRPWLQKSAISDKDRRQLQAILNNLLGFYERHIRLEETEVFSAARNLLSASGKETIGQEMAQRRNLTMDGTTTDGTKTAGCATASNSAADSKTARR
jgi:hemerythrin-like domain-containing protein